jgi:hypothetical protein
MAAVPFASLAGPSGAIDEALAGRFLTCLPQLPQELSAITKPKDWGSGFPTEPLLRLDTIRRWNAIAAACAREDIVDYARALSGPSGIGKSHEARLFALLGLHCGLFVEYAVRAFARARLA